MIKNIENRENGGIYYNPPAKREKKHKEVIALEMKKKKYRVSRRKLRC